MNLTHLPTHILTPGPVRVPESVSEAIALPPIHHRTPRFGAFWNALQSVLQYACQTQHPVMVLPGTGTAGMEMLMSSVLRPGSSVLVSVNGKFSARWERYLAAKGMVVIACHAEWGENITPEMLLATANGKLPDAAVLTHCETSTGQMMDLEVAAFQLKRAFPDIIILADVNSTLGIAPFYMDAWGIDGISFASQKGFMCPAGLCAVAVSDRLQERLIHHSADDAFSLLPYLVQCRAGSYPFTPPVQLLYGLLAAGELLRAEGLPSRWQSVHRRARKFRQWIEDSCGRYVIPYPVNGDVLTVFAPAAGTCDSLQQHLLTDCGIEIAGGQDVLNGKILRVAHFGYQQDEALDALIRAL